MKRGGTSPCPVPNKVIICFSEYLDLQRLVAGARDVTKNFDATQLARQLRLYGAMAFIVDAICVDQSSLYPLLFAIRWIRARAKSSAAWIAPTARIAGGSMRSIVSIIAGCLRIDRLGTPLF